MLTAIDIREKVCYDRRNAIKATSGMKRLYRKAYSVYGKLKKFQLSQ